MKKSLVIFLMVMAGSAGAWEVKGNPDKTPSIGISYEKLSLRGASYYSFNNQYVYGTHQDMKLSGSSQTFDLRVPVSPNLTLEGGVGVISSEKVFYQGVLTYRAEENLYGYSTYIKARVYFAN